ncbi:MULTISPECIES: LysR family transcriptional regulator [Vibrio]|uniref:LysR family transcriptional regulator n=3 Tax=Gammaproteobacteria TaxID=1236 RepID=A0AAJ3QKF5_9VIBR|nr:MULTISPECIES: LysR family transcriptional regulator [Vibrio]ASI88863.1 LysR family transcriptional regulator [Vibrio mediterranei]MCF4175442.1 LysR family transcriptional regulator [Vibrio sp. McD22-P3]MCG9624667.1 LysR family transcriptional regulator [Vibrio mediterranei]MCG9659982.1 LysR family transcriptional regulator [Vibrio mediterranei]MCG9665795.1 LysR family transcriptional regulator [Vibrio mediterranei]
MANWEGINEFVAVVETQSFTGAADRLATSVANISRRVNALEEKLGVKLFVRTTRKVSVTEVGATYYQHCKPLVDGLALAELAITQLQSTPKGKIKMTAPVTFGEQVLAPLMHEFLLMHPQIELDLILSNQKMNLVEEGFDLAVRLGRLEDSSMMARKLLDRHMFVCASPTYLENHGEPHTLSELKRHSCLRGSTKYWRFDEKGSERLIHVEGRVQCNSGYALVDAALKGLGIVQLPDYYVQPYLEAGELVEVLTPYRGDREGIWALYPQNRMLTSKVRTLIDYLSEALSREKHD